MTKIRFFALNIEIPLITVYTISLSDKYLIQPSVFISIKSYDHRFCFYEFVKNKTDIMFIKKVNDLIAFEEAWQLINVK